MKTSALIAALGLLASLDSGCRQADRAASSSGRLDPAPATSQASDPTSPSVLSGPQAAPATSTSSRTVEAVNVDGVGLTLSDCTLLVQTSGNTYSIKVDLPSDCAFGKRADGSVQVESTKQGPTLLVISSKPIPGREGDCDSKVRAVVVREQEVLVSAKMKESYFCGAVGPFDEPIFVVLAATTAR